MHIFNDVLATNKLWISLLFLLNPSVYLFLLQRLMGPDGMSMVNGTTGVHGEEYWTDGGTMSVSQIRPSSPQTQAQGPSQAPPQRQVSDVYSNTLPVRRPAPAKNKNPVGKISEHL